MNMVCGTRTTTTLCILACAAALLPGCRNPLTTYDDEYGWHATHDRLHELKQLQLPGASAPPPADLDPPKTTPLSPYLLSDGLRISLEQARAWTLTYNLDLKVEIINPEIARTSITEEEAAFEALFFARGGASDADPGQGQVFPDQFVRPFDLEPGVEIPLRSGGRATISLPMSREETFSGFDDSERYSSDLQFSISQPLLRGAGRWANTHRIRLAALDSQIAQSRVKLEVIRQLTDAERRYWLLYEAREILRVRQEQYENAVDQWNRAEALVEGRVEPEIEVIRAKAGVSRRLEGIIVAELIVRDLQRALKRTLNHPEAGVDSEVVLQPTSPPDPLRYTLQPPELINNALQHRLELLELELQLAQDYSTIDFARNQSLPLFTLDYTYRVDGAGSSIVDATEDLTHARDMGWRLGVNAEVPIGNQAAEARVHRAILNRLQRLATRELRTQAIKQEVLAAIDNLEASWQRIMAARQNVIFETRNYHAEQGQFRLGLRNSTEVLNAEDRLADARIAEIRAVIDYQIAQVDLAFATGTVLGAAHTDWVR